MSITGSKSLNSNNIEGVSTAGIIDQLQNQVPINATNITNLQQATTGITYSDISSVDMTTINNNVTITGTIKTGNIRLNNTDHNFRQIFNTYYNFMDTSSNVGGVNVGRVYSTSLASYYQLYDAGATFSFTFGTIGTTFPFQLTSTALATSVPNNITTTVSSPIPSLTITDSVTLNRLNFSPALDPGSYNRIVSTNDSVIFTTSSNGAAENETLVLTTNSNICGGIRLTATTLVLGNGGTIGIATPLTNMSIDGTLGTLNLKATSSIQIDAPTATFTNPPSCSVAATTANQLVTKSYVDNVSSNSPVGTIIMYGSNTIPPGWLLCNGSNVSKITYADLWDVIGDTFLTFPPPTGFFQLPSFVGLYPRGAGYNAGLTSVSTTLGQVMTGQVGRHGHISASMNSDTQGTTTSKSVVSAVSGLAGLIITSTSVSAPVVTTTATNGTTTTTLDTYNPLNSILTAETRPNNISVNYIIKFQTSATPAPLTTPTFTQTTSVLTIQNNASASGIINFVLDDASSVAQTPLSLSSTAITVALPVTCATAPTLASHLVNKTYVDGLVAGGVGLTSTDQTITGVKTFTNDLITSSCHYGRNDGFAFNVASTTGTTIGLYPIGYCWEILGVLSTPATGSNYAGIVASPALTKGVWAISGYMVINKGTGAYLAASNVSVLWDTVAGIRIYPASSGMTYPLLAASTAAKYIIPLGTINVVVTTAGAIQTITRMISCTIGTLTWQVSFTGVKIA